MSAERIALLAALKADVDAGIVERRSKEWERRRSEAMRADPVYNERRAAYQRAKFALKRGDPEPMAAYRAGLEVRRAPKPEPKPRNRFQCVQKQPHMTEAQRRAQDQIDAAVRAVQGAECASYIQDRGYRVRCFLPGGHPLRCVFRRTV